MNPYIDVVFSQMGRDPSLESAVHRWVARLECEDVEVVRANARVERTGRRRTSVHLTLSLPDGMTSAGVAHDDPYVAISETFREARRQLLKRPRIYVRAR